MTKDERLSVIEYSPLFGKYEETVDRESAHEILTKRTNEAAAQANSGEGGSWSDVIFGGGSSSAARERGGAAVRAWAR